MSISADLLRTGIHRLFEALYMLSKTFWDMLGPLGPLVKSVYS
jgi:hypothetical protein